MTVDALFGPAPKRGKKKSKPLRLRVIRPIYETLQVGEEATRYLDPETPLTSSASVAALFGFLAKETKEHFVALHLDAKNRLLCAEIVSVGSLNAAIVHPREAYKSALLSSAAAVLFVHNHPSGSPEPSREDIELTNRLRECGELLGIRLLDHVIVGHGRHHSFADAGQL